PPASQPPGTPFIELQTVDSTNTYARQRIQEGRAADGMAFFAHEQTAGKGQRGQSWAGEPKMNIALSLVLKPTFLNPNHAFTLSACIAVSVRNLFARYAGDETTLKWPNDLYWKDRKAGGILIESVMRTAAAGWDWAIVGIGININQTVFPDWLPNPVSLKQITGRTFEPVTLARELCIEVGQNYETLRSGGANALIETYNRHLYAIGRVVRLRKGNRHFQALIKGVTGEGALQVEHGVEETYRFGEVQWVVEP
ncbi:MAG: hypothetical protein RJA57_1255, partial [Bacteroidota bacterium]